MTKSEGFERWRQNSIFYLTAGAEYDDEAYVWVGQVQLNTSLSTKVSPK